MEAIQIEHTTHLFSITFIGEEQRGCFVSGKVIEAKSIIKAIKKFKKEFPNSEIIGIKKND